MRTWLYELLASDPSLVPNFGATQAEVGQRIVPRRSEETINVPNVASTDRRYMVFGLGNNTNEDLSEDENLEAHRQFFTIWIYDEGPSYLLIDDTVNTVKARLKNASDPDSGVMQVRWLETSQEFNNDTYKMVFRYVRFQAVIGRMATA